MISYTWIDGCKYKKVITGKQEISFEKEVEAEINAEIVGAHAAV